MFIVNDRADLALALGADGLHLGPDDLPAAAARRLLPPGMVLGSRPMTRARPSKPWRITPTTSPSAASSPPGTKAGFQLVGSDLVRTLRSAIPVPLVAIGGITVENVEQVIAAGADAVAVVSAICGAPDPAEATRRFLDRIETAQRGQVRVPKVESVPPGCYLLHDGEAGRNGSCSP
jgi:thiamine-phosphate pyrophosphorylase